MIAVVFVVTDPSTQNVIGAVFIVTWSKVGLRTASEKHVAGKPYDKHAIMGGWPLELPHRASRFGHFQTMPKST